MQHRHRPGPRDLKIVWDAGNGAAGEILRRMTAKLPGKHILLFDEIDGNFPNHHPDPTVPENLVDLQKAVAEHKADIGIGFDGDGDRIGAIDSTGRIVWGDQLLAIYAKEVLATHPGSVIIADEITPADTALMDPERVAGIATVLGGAEGHSAIMARALGLPAAAGVAGLVQDVNAGDIVIVHGNKGEVVVRVVSGGRERRR